MDYFPGDLGDFNQEQGEWFHQDIKTMETRYQVRWNVYIMADYCWSLKRDITDDVHKERRNFIAKSKRRHSK